MICGYARVSTGGQDLAHQLAQLRAAGCERVFQEKVSGASADRPQLIRALKSLAAGDVLMVTAVDRLARDTRDLLNILHEVRAGGSGFRSLAEPMVDTTSELSEVVIAVLGIAARWERSRIIERTAAGRAQAKIQGVKFGRHAKLTPHQQREALARLSEGETQRTVARSYNVSQATISRLRPSAAVTRA
jgi:DNA invertase Pin-like site-specific DNA recombinase